MKKISMLVLLALFVFSSNGFSAKGKHIANAVITMKCNGKTYTATTDDNGKFTIKDYDCDGDYTFSVKTSGTIELQSWSWGVSNSGSFSQGSGGGAGKVNVQDLSVTKRDAASGQATGKRQHKPIRISHTLCPDGKDQDCNGTVDRCVLELTYDGNTIQGMAINEKGLPGEKKPAKGNK